MATIRLKPILTISRLREVLDYDPSTGIFRWRIRLGKKVRIGAVAGWIDNYGYRTIQVDGKNYKGHRLAWLYVHSVWPPDDVDHKDVHPGNDWIDNLRPATRSQNHANTKLTSRNTSGFKGVHFFKGRWVSQIQHNGKNTYLGRFDTPQEAHSAYLAKAMELFGEFANPG